jgi:carboxyl-terminal processing protease
MSRWNLAWLLGITAAAVIGISITYSAPTPNAQQKHKNLKLMVDVLEEVQKRYVRELDQDKQRELVENMINGGLEKLDPHSQFIGADEFKQFQQASRGKFGGVGIRLTIDPRSGQFIVESPLAGTPAYEAGVNPGDIILKVDGKSIDSWNLRKVVDTIQGDPGTDVTLTVLHENAKKPVDLTMTRAEIKIESVMADTRDKINLKEWDFWVDPASKIAYIRINAFTETTVEELTRIVDGLQKAGMKGLIVDLRNNPGGLLQAAVDVSSMFIPEGKDVVTTKGRGGVVEEVFKSRAKGNMKPGTNYPMAILINRYSASASEIVAAALQDHARAVIIGERSFGKGSVQNVIRMEEGQTALKLTTASYWRPSGRNIHRFPDAKEEDEWGVKPDKGYDVKLTDEERIDYFRWRRDRDILRRPGQEPKPTTEKDKNGKEKKEFHDKVMDTALEYIRAELAKKNGQGQAPRLPDENPVANQAAPGREIAAERRDGVAEVADRSYRNVTR